MMKRKRYSADFKAKVALEVLRGLRTTNEIAAEFGVHPTQIGHWKKQDLESYLTPQPFDSPFAHALSVIEGEAEEG